MFGRAVVPSLPPVRIRRLLRTGPAALLLAAALALATSAGQPAPARAAAVWSPAPGTTWQWQIVGRIGQLRDVEMYDVDVEDAVPSPRTVRVPGFGSARWPAGTNAGIVERLHARGIVAICYLDSGAWESYRPDAHLFPPAVIGRSSGWEGERWLDLRPAARPHFAPIIWARFRLARAIGCDGIEPDQNNPIGNDPGFPISRADERSWYLEVARQAHRLGLSVGMKNGLEVLTPRLAAAFDWSLNEECFYFHECGRERPFVAAGKAVFQTEYTDDWQRRGVRTMGAVAARVCQRANRLGFSTLAKRKVPDASFVACREVAVRP